MRVARVDDVEEARHVAMQHGQEDALAEVEQIGDERETLECLATVRVLDAVLEDKVGDVAASTRADEEAQ